MYYEDMAKQTKELNRFELQLQQAIEDLMRDNKVKFSAFLKVLRPEIPETKSDKAYIMIHKAEYLKQLRASYSVVEIKRMLSVLGYELKFTAENTDIVPACYELKDDIKVKYVELMAVCELLGIKIEWVKIADRATFNSADK